MGFSPLGLGLGIPQVRAPFNFGAYLSGLSAAAYYDFIDTTRNFTTSTGPTNIASYGDAIGLGLDAATWGGKTLTQELAGQSELWNVVAGDFSLTNATLSIDGSGNITLTNTASAVGTADTSFALSAGTYHLKGNSDLTARVKVGSAVGLSDYYDSGTSTTSFDAYITVTGTTWVRLDANTATLGAVRVFSNFTLKNVPGYAATQSTSSYEPLYQSTGASFDGVNDYLSMNYYAGSGSNFIMALVTVPATISATQLIWGALETTSLRNYLAINTSGQLCAGLGTQSVGTIVGTTDLRGTQAFVGFTFNGTTVKLFVNTAVEYSAAQNGSPTVAYPNYLATYNNAGAVGGSYFAGSIKKFVAGTDFLTLSRYLQIRQALLA